ncbi:TRAP transporter small permease subunit [Paraglaciecola polaris]|uniref:TRAP transporter small permease protein n=1 Tax=Paraglaciecola polaris LMG 21857 TaxID=1129793 RepID=K6Z466_9ALTE|nr:TRAP transporter small permease subunit [Paraglaciecola polaris]GAC31021.1 c4-dicarboxylate transporter family protein, DctQ subunit [Paraglaciecola polaris LMG 21857]
MNSVVKLLGKFIDGVGHLCSLLMMLMILNVFYDVVMRYFFNEVSIGMQELEWHLFAAMFMFGIGYTLKTDCHVRVDVLYDNFSPRLQAYINLFGALLFVLPVTILILYYSWDYTLEAYEMGEGSADPGGLPHRFIIRGVIPASSVFLILCTFYVMLEQIQRLTGPDVPSGQHKDAL